MHNYSFIVNTTVIVDIFVAVIPTKENFHYVILLFASIFRSDKKATPKVWVPWTPWLKISIDVFNYLNCFFNSLDIGLYDPWL